MSDLPADLVLPKGLDDIDAAFMTKVLRHSGAITATNEVVSQEEQGVGMTAGYFSAIKKVRFSIAASVKLRPDYFMPLPFCARANDTTRGSCFSSRSAPSRLMMG